MAQQISNVTLTLFSDIPSFKSIYGRGRIEEGYRLYQLTFAQTSTLSERNFFFRVSRDGSRFAVSNQQWTAMSFEQLFCQYNSGNEYTKTWKTCDFLCGVDTFTPEEIQSAVTLWSQV